MATAALQPRTLPPEIIDQIIDCVASGAARGHYKTVLSNCSLTSRQWVPRSSHLLFRKAEVGTLDIQVFLSSAKSRERLSANIGSLVINGSLDITPLLDDIFRTLPLLRSMELWSNYLGRKKLTPLLATATHRLAHFKLSGIQLGSLPGFLLLFQHVDILELRSVEGEDVAPRVPTDCIPLSVGRLILNGCSQRDITLALQRYVRPTALFVNGFDRYDLTGICLFILHAAEGLEHINLLPTQDDANDYDNLTHRRTFEDSNFVYQ